MIDTIKGYIILKGKKYSDYQHLFENKSKSIKEGGYIISFNLSNFRISIKFDNENNPIKLYFNGSLPKFYFGNNLAQLDWSTTKDAVQMLSDNLNVQINNATLTRIDFGFNFLLEYPIYRYISCLVDYPRLERNQYKDSVTFFSKSGSKSLIFYDKIKEIKSSYKNAINSIPEEYQNQNILRYEICLKKLLKHNLKSGRVRVRDLNNDTVQKKIFILWLEGFEKVNKFSVGLDPLYLLNQRNGLSKYLFYHGIDKLGYDRVINSISELKFNVKHQSGKCSKIKKTLNKFLNDVKENTLDENLIDEMDNKIKFIQAII